MTSNSQGTVDTLDFGEVFAAANTPGPKVTFFVPTSAHGTTTADKSAAVLKGQLKTAAEELKAAGLSEAEAEAVLAPVRELTTDSSYWRQQSRGLVVFAAAGFHQAIRIPVEVAESVTVAENFHLLPLVPVLESAGMAYVLALSKNAVRLYEASRNTITQLPQGEIPESFEDVVGDLPDHQLQSRSIGAGRASFHGHSGSDDTETMLTEKFLRAVGEAVGKELGTARSRPLVVAAVAEHLPVFRKACPYPAVHDQVIPGNPEHVKPDELRSKAWKLLGDRIAAGEQDDLDQAMTQVHNGKGSLDLAEISQAAGEGRVDTLFLPRDGRRLSSPAATDLADAAVTATVRNSGTVRTIGDWDSSAEAVATFRY